MTYLEPERLTLHLQALLERRTALRAALESALDGVLTAAERDGIRQVLASIDEETSAIEMRLKALRASPGGGGTG